MRQLTIERTAAIIVFVLLFALAVRVPMDTDTGWHLRSGEYTLQNGMIHSDPFSHTFAGEPWINHSWGAQIVMAAVWNVGGDTGLALLTALLATGGMAFVYRLCAGNVYVVGLTLVLGAAAAAVFWSPRPQMFSFFLSAVVLYLLHRYRRDGVDRLWWIPVVMMVWGNLHAGFTIGFLLLGGTIAGEVLSKLTASNQSARSYGVGWPGIRKLVLVTAVSAAALFINPYGAQLLAVPFGTVSIGALQNYIQEWNSPNFHERQTWPFVGLLLALLGAAGASRLRLSWTDFVLTAGTAFMALLAGRNIAVFAVVATPVLSWHLDDLLRERGWALVPARRATRLQVRLNVVLIAVVVVGALAKIALALTPALVAEAQAGVFPVEAIAYVNASQPEGPLFNSYNWGGYLIFRAPDYPVFVDGRTDLYGDAFLTGYLTTATGGEGWRETLDRYGVNLVLVEAGSGLARQLRADDAWRLAHEDALAVVFERERVA